MPLSPMQSANRSKHVTTHARSFSGEIAETGKSNVKMMVFGSLGEKRRTAKHTITSIRAFAGLK